jgi:hypothetical protein
MTALFLSYARGDDEPFPQSNWIRLFNRQAVQETGTSFLSLPRISDMTPTSSPATVPVPRSILVTGDVVIDHQIYVGQQRRPGSTMRLGTLESAKDGGAALLADLLIALAAASPAEAIKREIHLGVERPTQTKWPAEFHGYGVFQPHAKDPSDAKAGEVWRLHEPLGFGEESANRFVPLAAPDAIGRDHDVVVLDDAGLGFRFAPAKAGWPRFLSDPEAKWPEWLVLKLSAPIGCGDLWRAILATNKDQERLRDRCVVIVSINDLRAEGAQVSQSLSWERTALDLVADWDHNPRLRSLRACRYVIVSFKSDGAVFADFSQQEKPSFYLLFDPGHLEGDFADSLPGTVYGLQTCLAAGIIDRFPDRSMTSGAIHKHFLRGIQAGLAGMRRLSVEGHGNVSSNKPGFLFSQVAAEILRPTWHYGATAIPPPNAPGREQWTILQGFNPLAPKSMPQFGTARRVALRGTDELTRVPYLRFGDLFVIERHEIESLRSLRRLVLDYEGQRDASKPLSIAVFGPPGAGKSFGVKQIAKAVLAKQTPILEFNLAQFANANELIGLFHQVRDKALEGRTPVVFWDEFDSMDLFWLQYLLAPMQDGRFQDGQISHPIGKCIFVFAGGTCHDFQSFGAISPGLHADPEHFKKKKGPDFISRLSGYLNVLGPNPRQVKDPKTDSWHNDPTDVSYPIRRALFLRAKLTKSPTQRLTIDAGILRALLEVSRYMHGSRSLEKLLEQLRQSSRTGVIVRGDLPPTHLLGLHVDSNEFLRIVGRDIAFDDVEKMAEAIHEFYRDLARENGWPIIFDVPYADLADEVKDDNRAAVGRIAEVLSLAGLYLVKADTPASVVASDEIMAILLRNLESLAEAEHDGWMEYKTRQGWRFDPNRDDGQRLHHLLKPFQELSEKEREKDRNAGRRYPEIVARQGYRIVSEPPGSEEK